MPPEWEKHSGTWTTYPQAYETFFDRLEEARDEFVQMVKYVSLGETVHINVDNEKVKKDLIKRLEKYDVKGDVKIHIIPTNDAWCRDYGAIFVKNKEGKLLALDFRFNAWGNKYPYELDNKVAKKMAEILGVERLSVDMVLEGGSIDVNGKGCLLTTESCLLNPNRNPDMTKEDIENALRNYLGVEKVLWLKDGIVGDDTDGHVDDITRFVSQDTIITAIEEDKSDPNYEPLQENLERLKSFTDANGKPFNIITLPMPDPVYYKYPDSKEPERLPASYANFYISNTAVIVPIYNCDKDKIALEILQRVFPDRAVIGIYAYDIVVGLGAFHCLTQQIPEGKLR
ncbi:MAG: agmatine deiminase family protein [Aquificae bacterium]|nr:agmatine deiminase family protein [Aquificota bacterium]